MKKLLISALAAMSLTACAKSGIDEALTTITLRGESEAITRTTVGEVTNTTTQLLWSVGDVVGVFGDNTKNAAFTASISEPSAKATFTGAVHTGDSPKYVYFPYNNASTSESSVAVTVPAEQYFTVGGPLQGDVRVSRSVKVEGDSFSTQFRSLTTLLSLNLDASGVNNVSLDEKLQSITLSGPEGMWTGDFKIDLTDAAATLTADGNNQTEVKIVPTAKMTLAEAAEVPIYAMIAPAVKSGDVIEVAVRTNQTLITCKVNARLDLQAGRSYDVPLLLRYAGEENDLVVEKVVEQPTFAAFKFEAANNSGSMLATAAYYDGSATTTTTSTEYTDYAMAIDEEQSAVSGVIPYLYNFNLAPTFEVSEGATVWVGDEQQTSGQSVQDFTSPVTYTVRSADGVDHNYTVSVTNTGLPVVVLNQNDPTFANVPSTSGYIYQDGYSTYLTEQYMLGTKIPCKLTDFDLLEGKSTIKIYEKGVATFDLTCGFRMRGNSTANFPKKPMAIKLDKKADLLGGSNDHKRWCLLASWTDRSLMRNSVAFKVANTLKDHFTGAEGEENGKGLIWNPSGMNVELVLNGVHVGSYYLCEQIKIDKKRLNIQDEYDATDNYEFANCGFLMECDDNYDENCKFKTSKRYVPFMFKDDVPSDFQETMEDFINAIETNLINGNYSTAYESLDINSVIDWWFVYELAMNAEYRHPKSVYYYRNGEGKLFAGPVWDFDYQTFPNPTKIADINKRFNKTGADYTMTYSQFISATRVTSSEPAVWYPLLFNDATFKARVKSRWNSVYTSLAALESYIDERGQAVALSDEYNVKIWPFDSAERTGYSWYIDYAGDEFMTHDELVTNFKDVYKARLDGMNSSINAF